MNKLERAKYLTGHYDALKGLKLVPIGLFLLVLSTRDLGWNLIGREGDCTYSLPLLLLVIAMYFAVDRYYARRFGSVQPRQPNSALIWSIVSMSVFFGVVVLEAAVKLPFSLIGVVIGAALLFSGWKTHRIHYIIGGAAMLVLGLLPLTPGLANPEALMPFGFWFNFTLGLLWTVLGLVDHFILVRGMNLLKEGEYARAE
jgi:hypothetical protein